MRNKFYFILFCTVFLFGCTGQNVDISSLISERDSLKEASLKQQKELENLNTFVNAVSNGLDSIAKQEGLIRGQGREGTGMTREQMKQSLAELADLLARQKAHIARLEDSLDIRGTGADGLHNIVAHLNEQLEAKEKMIGQLRSEINNKNTSIKTLQSKIEELNSTVENLDKKSKMQQQALVTQSDMINECYVKIGTKKELKRAGILDGKKLNASSLKPDNFVRVDIREFVNLPLPSKKPKILTTMPTNSYSIVRNSDGTSQLTIKDPTLFWSSSNYLVISLD